MTTDTVTATKVSTATAPRSRARTPLGSIIRHTLMIAAGVIMIYPLLWLLVSSLRPADEIFRDPGLLLTGLDFSNYTQGWNALGRPFSSYIVNSGILVLGGILGNLFSCTLTAYAFARLEFRGKKWMFAAVLVTIMIPIHVIIVPQYIFFSQLHLVNTFVPLLLPKFLATDSFYIFLMVQFIRAIPRELDEAARIDGAGHVRILLQVILPLMAPALAATAIFTFIGSWNDFFSALIYLTSPDVQTVPIALRSFIDTSGTSSFGPMFAMSIVSLVPVFLVFLFGQRYLVKGIATTGLK
ncbi:carbohydrate ABC transporter permease [Arthrobacter sp. NA-172]|uniref:carbohydrate ABC transporter permease n=1 Tax=Arthrobacter sp. NA-172 TaxID=3367524 RepID=UPI003754CD99